MLFADGAQGLQLLPQPDPAHGVVGGGQDEHPGAGLCKMPVQLVKVHGVAARTVHQLARGQSAAVVPDGVEEGVIDRSEHRYRVAGPGEDLHQPVQGGDDARGKPQPVLLHGVAVPVPLPAEKGPVVAVRDLVIAKSAVGRPGGHGLTDAGRGLKIHVSHPQGQQAGLSELLPGAVPLDAVRAVAVDVNKGFAFHKPSSFFYTIRYFLPINNRWLLAPSSSGFSQM